MLGLFKCFRKDRAYFSYISKIVRKVSFTLYEKINSKRKEKNGTIVIPEVIRINVTQTEF